LKFSGIEKISHDSKTTDKPQHLIAKKNGTIEKMHITKGVPLVSVNDYVTIGKRLVSGNLSDVIESEEDNEPTNDQEQLVAAQGEIFARTWYEIQVTVPLSVNYEHISERKIDKYYISFQNKRLLLWGFQQPNYSDIHTTTDEYTLNIFNRTFPFKFIKQSIHEKEQINYVRSKKEAIQVGMLEAEAALKLQLSANAKILSQKVLHEATGSGKVRLNLLITVSEDIAEEIPITQGD
ncbi:MAG TPA: sporulation protein YqfD, partial [Bacillota bacterium]|nr:sporulation protein YqfD [Bacillota bacterium]